MVDFRKWEPSEATRVRVPEPKKPLDGIPKGWTKVEAYTDGSRIVVEGSPAEDDEEHNCDQMGCGFAHVLCVSEIPEDFRGVVRRAHGIQEAAVDGNP